MSRAPHVSRKIASALLLPLACTVLAGTLLCGGCASETGPAASSRTGPRAAQEDSFTAGEHRAPTAHTLYSMARILETQGKDFEAQYVLRSIIQKYPAFLPAYCDLSETLVRERRFDEAIATLQTGLAHASGLDAVLLNDLGMCLLLRDDPDGALQYFTRAAGASPDDARYRSNMAVALGMSGRYDEALSLYCEVLPAADAHFNLGVLCQSRHDQARAMQEFHLAHPSAPAETVPTTEPSGPAEPFPTTRSSARAELSPNAQPSTQPAVLVATPPATQPSLSAQSSVPIASFFLPLPTNWIAADQSGPGLAGRWQRLEGVVHAEIEHFRVFPRVWWEYGASATIIYFQSCFVMASRCKMSVNRGCVRELIDRLDFAKFVAAGESDGRSAPVLISSISTQPTE